MNIANNNRYNIKSYYSMKTNRLIEQRYDIQNTSFKRKEKSKKNRKLILKDIQILMSKFMDYIYSSFKNPITCFLFVVTITLCSFTFFNEVNSVRFESKFFNSMESDSLIPKDTLLRVQQHYYRIK